MTAGGPDSSAVERAGLEVELDRPLPQSLPPGPATEVFCAGSCLHQAAAIEDLALIVDGTRHRPAAQGMPRPDGRSGFWGTVPVGRRERPRDIELGVEARLADGMTAAVALGTIAAAEPPAPASFATVHGRARPLIAVCMTTFDPDPELFRVQIESIRAQTDPDWVCVISDDCSAPDRFAVINETVAGDERFVVARASRRLGFYKNFERALYMAPAEAELIALSDHDDRWYPDKLETLRAALGGAELAYSDARLVDEDGAPRRNTLWRGRRSNHTNLASLLISNTVPGAASLLRRRVLDRALPFPDGPGWDFHDHWLALVALALGDVAYVDRPLYDYVQHPGAVLGRVVSEPDPDVAGDRAGLAARIARRRGFLARWRSAYFAVYLHADLQSRVLETRCSDRLTHRKRRALRWIRRASRSPFALAWLAARPARALAGRNETLGVEATMVKGLVWRHLLTLRGQRAEAGPNAAMSAVPSFDPHGAGPRLRRWLARR